MLWIRLNEGIEEHACPFNVSDFGVGFYYDAVKGSKVAFWVDRSSRSRVRCCSRYLEVEIEKFVVAVENDTYLVELKGKDLVTSLTDFDKVSKSTRLCRCDESTHLETNLSVSSFPVF